MKVLGQKMNQHGQLLGQQTVGGGMTLGSKLSHHIKHSHAHHQTERVHKSDLERNSHHIPKDGQSLFTHGIGRQRLPWQRKKNH